MQTTKGALRNITTGILHTNVDDIYGFLESYIGEEGIMTHQLGSASKALQPILKSKLPEEWFTKEWIKEGLDESVEVPDMTATEKISFWKAYSGNAARVWDKIKDKTTAVKID
jgi:hypothetical protein